MISGTECPATDELRALSQGRLRDEESDVLLSHVNECQNCQSELDTVSDKEDSLLAALREPSELERFQSDSDFQVSMVKALGALAIANTDDSDEIPHDVPRSIGEYKIVRPLGQGGMGCVYLAKHTKLGREVALKVLAQNRMGDSRVAARFEAEMQAVGRLSHPNIVAAHDARDVNGTAVLVTEYIDGYDLGELLRRSGPVSVGDACELARQAAVALAYISEQGFVHRDVKPSNIMLDRHGQAKLLDLGLARVQHDKMAQTEMTRTGQAMGTADYMAPEQVTDSRSVDVRADIYSLGCTLLKLLTGKAPFATQTHATAYAKMTAHVSAPPPSLTESCPDAPTKLVKLIDSMLAKEAAARPQSAREVAEQLAEFAGGHDLSALVTAADQADPKQEKEPAQPTEMPQPAFFWDRRLPVAWFIATAIGAAAFGFALGLIVKITYPDGTTVMQRVPEGSSVAIEPEDQNSPLGKAKAGSSMGGASAARDTGDRTPHVVRPNEASVQELLEQAAKLYEEVDLLGAREKYDAAWSRWAERVNDGLPIGAEALREQTKTYRTLLSQLDEDFPPPGFSFELLRKYSNEFGVSSTEMVSLIKRLEERTRTAVQNRRSLQDTTGHSDQDLNPELVQVRIPVEYADGRPAPGAEVTLQMQGSEDRPVQVTSRAGADGLAFNRTLPYGKYSMEVRVPDGDSELWSFELYDVRLDFGGTYSRTFYAPVPGKRARVRIKNGFAPGKIEGLRFGYERRKSHELIWSPEPDAEADDWASQFPTVGDGITNTALIVEMQLTRTVMQPGGEPISWEWKRNEDYYGDQLMLTDQNSIRLLDVDWECTSVYAQKDHRYFKDLGDTKREHRVQYCRFTKALKLANPMWLEFASGDIKCEATSIFGKANSAVVKSLGLDPEIIKDVWIGNHLLAESGWVPRIVNLSDWSLGEGHHNLAIRTLSLKDGETKEFSIGPVEPTNDASGVE